MHETFLTKTPALKGRVKQRYADFIVEEVTPDGRVCEVKRYDRAMEQRANEPFVIPEEKKEHLIVDLEKVNTDTIAALSTIARGLSVSHKRIGYAGLKDKRGITCQRISLYDPDVAKVARFGVKGIELRNPVWSDSRIELGDLLGNQFIITVRNMDASEEDIRKIAEQFIAEAQKGVPNYFGTQRFGGKRDITHRVGKLLLQKRWKDAIMLYLTQTYEEEKEDMKAARIYLAKTTDFRQALRLFPMEARQEKALINHLIQHPEDYLGALTALPTKIRYLFVHAYQSHIFNRIIDERIKQFGDRALGAIDGDVIDEKTGEVLCLLPGFETTYASGIAGEIEKRVVESEGVPLADFRVLEMTELSSKGERKSILLTPERMKIVAVGKDEFNEGKNFLTISFFLSKGNYATTILRELIKEEVY